jgi:hypothetical protein
MKTWEKVQDSVHLGDVPGGCKERLWTDVRCRACLLLGLERDPNHPYIAISLERSGR